MAKAKPAVSASPFPDWDPERAEDMFKIWEYQPNLHLASTMQQFAGYDDTLGQDGARPPLLIGGRRWWAALGRLSSALALTLAVVVELMFVMRCVKKRDTGRGGAQLTGWPTETLRRMCRA